MDQEIAGCNVEEKKTGFLYCNDVNCQWLYKSKRGWVTKYECPLLLLCFSLLLFFPLQGDISDCRYPALCSLSSISQNYLFIFSPFSTRMRLVIPQD